MLIHYLKIFIRNLWRSKSFSLINITGLSVGITCCIFISIYVRHELSYDNFQEKGDRIARVIMEYSMGGNTNSGNYTSTKVGPSFKANFPEVENFVRMELSKKIVRNGEKVFMEKRFLHADSTFFNLFSFNLLSGQKQSALSGPNKLVISRSAAKKYFDSEDVVGKTLKVSSMGTDYLITGVVEDSPNNSQIKFDFLASFSSLGLEENPTYWNANYTTYLLLKDEASIAKLQSKIPGFMKKEMANVFSGNDYLSYQLEPLKKVHLYSEHPGFEVNGSIKYVYIISAVALLILTIACFTFINLSTAKSVERAKEIGIRKVTGALRNQIFWQFIGESLFIVSLSTLISLFAATVLLPSFSSLMHTPLELKELVSLPILIFSGLIIIIISFTAGAYPAFILSGFQPVKVLKGAFKNTGSGVFLRKALFVFQFAISAFLIICAFIIQKQLHYVQNKKLGYDKEHIVVLPYDIKVHEKYTALKTELKKNASIVSIAKGDFLPNAIMGGYSMQKPEMLPDKSYAVNANPIDEEYLKTCGIKFISGTNITDRDREKAEDEKAPYFYYILNESAARQMGWSPEEAIGKKMFMDVSRPGEVKGVVKDFHFSSLHEPIKPLVLFPGSYGNHILVKINGAGIESSLDHIKTTWKTLMTHRPFDYYFLDENYKAMYEAEINLGKAINVFTALAMLLACLGLYGLSSYSIHQRTKEIGILKVLGAPLWNIVLKLSGNFMLLVAIAILISIPLAWLSMNKWLMDFAYKISISPTIFIFAALASFIIAFLTISFKAIKAARANPVKSIKTE